MNEFTEELSQVINDTINALNELQTKQHNINKAQTQISEEVSNFNNNLMKNLDNSINESVKKYNNIFNTAQVDIKRIFENSQESLNNFKKEIENISSNAKKITLKQIVLSVLISLFVGILGGVGLSCYFVNEKFYEWEQNALSEKVYLERKNKESYENANHYIKFLADYKLFNDIVFEIDEEGKPTIYISEKRISKSVNATTSTTGKKWKAFEMTKK